MFLRCIDNCASFIMTTSFYSAFSEWDYSLWPEIRVEIAKAYPTEFIKFTLLIEKMSVVKDYSDVEFYVKKFNNLRLTSSNYNNQNSYQHEPYNISDDKLHIFTSFSMSHTMRLYL